MRTITLKKSEHPTRRTLPTRTLETSSNSNNKTRIRVNQVVPRPHQARMKMARKTPRKTKKGRILMAKTT